MHFKHCLVIFILISANGSLFRSNLVAKHVTFVEIIIFATFYIIVRLDVYIQGLGIAFVAISISCDIDIEIEYQYFCLNV
jgi:ABC-type uncharacterized transport system permease subunit